MLFREQQILKNVEISYKLLAGIRTPVSEGHIPLFYALVL